MGIKSSKGSIHLDGGKTITPELKGRHQVIDGIMKISDGAIIQPCDAHRTSLGGTSLLINEDKGSTWIDPGEDKAIPPFVEAGQVKEGPNLLLIILEKKVGE